MLFGFDPETITGREAYVGKVSFEILDDLHKISSEDFLIYERAKIAEDKALNDLQNFLICEKEGKNIFDFSGCYPGKDKTEEEFLRKFLVYLNDDGINFQSDEVKIKDIKLIGTKNNAVKIGKDNYWIDHKHGFVLETIDFGVFEGIMEKLQEPCARESVDDMVKMKDCLGTNFKVTEDKNYIKFEVLTNRILKDTQDFMRLNFSVEKDTIKKGALF